MSAAYASEGEACEACACGCSHRVWGEGEGGEAGGGTQQGVEVAQTAQGERCGEEEERGEGEKKKGEVLVYSACVCVRVNEYSLDIE